LKIKFQFSITRWNSDAVVRLVVCWLSVLAKASPFFGYGYPMGGGSSFAMGSGGAWAWAGWAQW